MIEKIYKTIDSYSMLKEKSRLMLCVSGGADSTAMLYAFNSIAGDMKLKLHIAHMNHCLRGIDSDNDQAYVEHAGRMLGVPVSCNRQDTKKFAKENSLSIEDAARRIRYDFFMDLAKRLGIAFIATAHTADDQAETILMRIIRGSGFKGVCGIPAVNCQNGINIIRPLIDITRREIMSFLSEKKIVPRQDVTNSDTKFLRNKIRFKLIPLLEKDYNQDIKSALVHFSELAQKDYAYLKSVYDKIFKSTAEVVKGKSAVFLLPEIKKQNIAVRRALARCAIEAVAGRLDNIEYRHWEEIESLMDERPAGSRVDLPNRVSVIKGKTRLSFIFQKKAIKKKPCQAVKINSLPAVVRFRRHWLSIELAKKIPDFSKKPRNVEYVNLCKTDFPLTLRAFMSGDRMRPLGMPYSKKVSDIFIDDKIPCKRRGNIPILVSNTRGILCVLGIRISDNCRIGNNASMPVKLELLTRH
jgi:tRNA(Ile)-lysidine synthase